MVCRRSGCRRWWRAAAWRAPAHYDPPMGFERDPVAFAATVAFVRDNPARFVFLAVGSPRQEYLAAAIGAAGGATGTGLCIGASLEFLAGARRRAPRFMRRIGTGMAVSACHRSAPVVQALSDRQSDGYRSAVEATVGRRPIRPKRFVDEAAKHRSPVGSVVAGQVESAGRRHRPGSRARRHGAGGHDGAHGLHRQTVAESFQQIAGDARGKRGPAPAQLAFDVNPVSYEIEPASGGPADPLFRRRPCGGSGCRRDSGCASPGRWRAGRSRTPPSRRTALDHSRRPVPTRVRLIA